MKPTVWLTISLSIALSGCTGMQPKFPNDEAVNFKAVRLFASKQIPNPGYQADLPGSPEHLIIPSYIDQTKAHIAYYRVEVLGKEDHEWTAGEANLFGGTVGAIGAWRTRFPP